jgi:serine protease Do
MPFPGFGEIAERLRRSTVHISTGRNGHGSGIIVKPEGVIVTNAHVVGARPLEAELWDGRKVPATVTSRDAARDLAVLRIGLQELPAATLADSDALRVGEPVIAIGNPWGLLGAVTTGVIHALGRVRGLGSMKWIQADAHLAPGNSGGPLADARGRLVGVNTMVAGEIGLAVPSNAVARMWRGRIAKAPMGIAARPVAITVGERERFGVMILEIAEGGAAEAASMLQGDILVGAGGREWESTEDFERVLEGDSERVARFHFVRGDRAKIRSVAIRLGLRSVAAA